MVPPALRRLSAPNASVLAALAAAVLFGVSTPLAKTLLVATPPVLLAGLLYAGSGLGLSLVRLGRGFRGASLTSAEWPWLIGAILAGGLLGPVLLMYGLAHTSAAQASLLLNLESVLTALLAWVVFRENAGRQVVLGMALIVAGGVLLAWPAQRGVGTSLIGAVSVAAACACWALDNNLTRSVSGGDPVFIAAAKGLAAGITNIALALGLGAHFPAPQVIAAALTVGFLGYGVSLALYVLALRGLGAARAGAYFSTAPFVGAALAIAVFGEPVSWLFWLAALLMAGGVWLHLTEIHEHEHAHPALTHAHPHRHDAHHQHEHAGDWDGSEPHTHEHTHAPLVHAHPHYPDVHHRHKHSRRPH
jgi:drug/metabolite transporter (DMT)-like permease